MNWRGIPVEWRIGLVVFIIVVPAFNYWLWFGGTRSTEEPPRAAPERTAASSLISARLEAKWACRDFVERSLKAPSTAKFPSNGDFSVNEIGDTFEVTGYVDAQNSFGAMLRTQFNCRVSKVGDDWRLVSLTTSP